MRKFFLFLAVIAILNLNFANATDNGSGDEIVPASRNLGIGVNSTSQRLTLNGALAIRQSARPVNISGTLQSQGWGRMYLNGTTNNLCFIDKDNLHYDLLDTGSGSGTSYINSLGDAYSDFSGTGIGDTVFLGFKAGGGETTVANIENTTLGAYAGNGMTNSARNNTFVGFKVFNRSSFQGSYNTGLGSLIDIGSTTSSKNILIGYAVGNVLSSIGSDNVVIGAESLGTSIGLQNSIVGAYSGKNLVGDKNVFFGYGIAQNNYNNTVNNSTLIGFEAGKNIAQNNSSSANTFIGARAGYLFENGDNNLLIGANVNAISNRGNNQINIGNSYFRSSAGNIGIEVDPDTNPKYAKFVINGSLAIRKSSRPANNTAASIKAEGWGRIYLNGTTNNLCFIDNGNVQYDLLQAGTWTGGIPAGADGSVQFKSLASNGFAADPNNFHYDTNTSRLGIKTNNPLATLVNNGSFAAMAKRPDTGISNANVGLESSLGGPNTISMSTYFVYGTVGSNCGGTCTRVQYDALPIANGSVAGQILHLVRTNYDYDLQFNGDAAKLHLNAGADYTMGKNDSLTLMWVNGSTGWVELFRSDN